MKESARRRAEGRPGVRKKQEPGFFDRMFERATGSSRERDVYRVTVAVPYEDERFSHASQQAITEYVNQQTNMQVRKLEKENNVDLKAGEMTKEIDVRNRTTRYTTTFTVKPGSYKPKHRSPSWSEIEQWPSLPEDNSGWRPTFSSTYSPPYQGMGNAFSGYMPTSYQPYGTPETQSSAVPSSPTGSTMKEIEQRYHALPDYWKRKP